MPWIQTHITVSKPAASFAEALLEVLGSVSVTLTDAGDEPQLEPTPGEERIWSKTIVTGLFDAETDQQQLHMAIADAMNAQKIDAEINVETLADQPWERAWLDNFKPMQFGKHLWVVPEGMQLPENAQQPVILTLDPGLAFGTGTHATTSLCLSWLDSISLYGKSVIDYGCGSGILAIAALLLGAEKALGIDYDPQALIASEQNAKTNHVMARLSLQGIETDPSEQCDILVANILASVLLELADKLADMVKPGGQIALSGILAEQAEEVRNTYSTSFKLQPTQQLEDWVLISGTRC